MPTCGICLVSRHPASHFVTDLVATRAVKKGRHVLYDTPYSFYLLAGEAEKRQRHSVNEIKDLLENEFHIPASKVTGLDARLVALIATKGKANP